MLIKYKNYAMIVLLNRTYLEHSQQVKRKQLHFSNEEEINGHQIVFITQLWYHLPEFQMLLLLWVDNVSRFLVAETFLLVVTLNQPKFSQDKPYLSLFTAP